MIVTSSSRALDSDLKVVMEGGEGCSRVISLRRESLDGTEPALESELRELSLL